MVEKDAVSKDFKKQVLGYGLTTAEIVYRRPDHRWLLQTYVWQDYDMFPNFPALKDFLAFWETKLEGPLFAVTVAHSKLIKPAELRAVDGVLPAALTRARRVGCVLTLLVASEARAATIASGMPLLPYILFCCTL